MVEGTIVKSISGYYYVPIDGKLIECRARGKFRNTSMIPLVGDRVELSYDSNLKGIIEKIQERKNSFIRPSIANIDQFVFIAANSNPITDPYLIDRVSVIAEHSNCDIIICINKTDLNIADNLYDIYTKTRYKVIKTSAKSGEGLSDLKESLEGKISCFTGDSGVGKSSILNCLLPELNIKVNDVSEKLGRGKHTTRHVELYQLDKCSFVADTPGFASFDVNMIADIDKTELQFCFNEFKPYIGNCRFDDCHHINEPNCAVLNAVKNKEISVSRHESYKRLFDIISCRKSWEK